MNPWILSCLELTSEVFSALEEYKMSNNNIESLCRDIISIDMIKIDMDSIIDGELFQSKQIKNIEQVRQVIKKKYDEIKKVLIKLQASRQFRPIGIFYAN